MLHSAPVRRQLQRGIRQGLQTLWRERQWAGSLGAMLGVAVLIQMLVTGHIAATALETILRERADLKMELRDGVTSQTVGDLYAELQQLPGVRKVSFVTKEQAYDRARTADPELVTFLETYQLSNPFRDALTITLESLDEYAAVLSFLGEERWQTIIDPTFLAEMTAEQEYVQEVARLTTGIRALALIIVGIGCAALLFIVMELARGMAIARSEEVLVERLAGAEATAILIPFAAEAAAILMMAIAASALLSVGLVTGAGLLFPALQADGVLAELGAKTGSLLAMRGPFLLGLELLLAPVLATMGTWLGIAAQVKNPRLSFAGG